MAKSGERLAVSDQPAMKERVEEDRARQEADDEARHVMGAVPIILEASLLVPVLCLVVAVLVVLFR